MTNRIRPAESRGAAESTQITDCGHEGERAKIVATFATQQNMVLESRGVEGESTMHARSVRSVAVVARSLDQSAASLQGDAPACDVCGAITVRSGTCYKCLNCGASLGCS